MKPFINFSPSKDGRIHVVAAVPMKGEKPYRWTATKEDIARTLLQLPCDDGSYISIPMWDALKASGLGEG